jgi:hypothetical protein
VDFTTERQRPREKEKGDPLYSALLGANHKKNEFKMFSVTLCLCGEDLLGEKVSGRNLQ